MANDTTSCTIIGRLTRDAESRNAGGKTVAVFSVACGYYGGKDNQDAVSYFDVEHWDPKIMQYLIKGKQVAIVGTLRQERWNKDGQSHSNVKIIAQSIQLLGDARNNNNGTTAPADASDDVPF